jgi:hypothetical protein
MRLTARGRAAALALALTAAAAIGAVALRPLSTVPAPVACPAAAAHPEQAPEVYCGAPRRGPLRFPRSDDPFRLTRETHGA